MNTKTNNLVPSGLNSYTTYNQHDVESHQGLNIFKIEIGTKSSSFGCPVCGGRIVAEGIITSLYGLSLGT